METTYWQVVRSCTNRQYQTGIEQPSGMFLPEEVYIQALDSLVLACVDVILELSGQVLIAKRSWQPQPDWWIIGGRMYKGELYEQAAQRNIHRELGLVVAPERFELLNFYSFIWDKRAQNPIENGCHMLSAVMLLHATERERAALTLNEEYETFAWVAPEVIMSSPETYHPALAQMVKDVARKLG